ncbi:signal recognition particle 9 kDa protein-like, partial [Vigna angularis]|uniref:signal recognition particle 9 kDa protein-like n=1 Tax=Phaseolus angularis TaxID=3914 RepID=UPI0022B4B8AD
TASYIISLVILISNCQLLYFLQCLKYKTDQAQEAKKMEKLNNMFFALMARGPDVDLSEVTGKEQMDAQPSKKGRGRKQ